MARNVSFHIGIGSFNTAVYPTAVSLKSAHRDAREMYNLAADFGYTPFDGQPRGRWDGDPAAQPPSVLLDGQATYENVVALFRQATGLLKDEGDRCFITLSSHGTQVRNVENGPNRDGLLDEAVCLHDFTLRDDVLHGLLSQFEKGVNVVLVLDCCHSGATSPKTGAILESVKNRVRDAFVALIARFSAVRVAMDRPALGAAKATPKPEAAAPELAADLEDEFKDFGKPDVRANVIAFQACGPNEVTFDGANDGDLSVYTRKFVDAARAQSVTTLAGIATAIKDAQPQIPGCTPRFQTTSGMDLTLSLRP